MSGKSHPVAIQRLPDGAWYVGTADKQPVFKQPPTNPTIFRRRADAKRRRVGLARDAAPGVSFKIQDWR